MAPSVVVYFGGASFSIFGTDFTTVNEGVELTDESPCGMIDGTETVLNPDIRKSFGFFDVEADPVEIPVVPRTKTCSPTLSEVLLPFLYLSSVTVVSTFVVSMVASNSVPSATECAPF